MNLIPRKFLTLSKKKSTRLLSLRVINLLKKLSHSPRSISLKRHENHLQNKMHTRSSPNRQTLNHLAEEAGIEGYESMPKTVLFAKLSKEFNFERLMRIEARKQRIQDSSNKKRKASSLSSSRSSEDEEDDESREPTDSLNSSSSSPLEPALTSRPAKKAKKMKLNTLDPIMMTPIGKKKTFKFIRPNGSIIQFNVDSLIDFMITSGDFTDPETRLPFSDEQLKEIDSIGKEIGLEKPSVYEAKTNDQFYSDAKFRRDALLGLERCAGEVVADILELVEDGDPDNAQMQLAMQEFPSFVDYYRQIRDADPEYAAKCISHWKTFILGPPNHPNYDEYGLLKVVMRFLKNCEDGRF